MSFGNMSDYKECVCADDDIMFVNSRLFRHHEVLSHMLGITNDFAPPETDDEGRLLFLKNFNISRNDFAQCQVFLGSGHVQCVETVANTFSIFGGCESFDIWLSNVQKRMRLEETKRTNNPMHPADDILDMFSFEVHPFHWEHGEEWSVTMKCSNMLWWWRKTKKSV